MARWKEHAAHVHSNHRSIDTVSEIRLPAYKTLIRLVCGCPVTLLSVCSATIYSIL